ncbi:MAG: InlB B-repeat-containing protein, partial [Solobacterium sp.]|nr:InlB B-repeat-containing protein [Solobacterium sp.]
WSAPNNASSHYDKTPPTFTEQQFFNVDPYHLEFHARKLAVAPSAKKIHVIYHEQNPDGTWSRNPNNRIWDVDTLTYSKFSVYFPNTAAFNYSYYYWTNGVDEYTTDVNASNPDLTAYTGGSLIVVYNNQVVNDYDGDGQTYMHVYKTRNKYNLHLENTDGTVLNLYYGEPLSNYQNILNNPVKPSNVPSHYVFTGWYTTDTFQEGTMLKENATMSSHDRFLYARWEEPRVNVTVVSNGATSLLPATVTIPMMSSVHKDIPNIPSKDGYWFDGWYKDPAFTQPFDINESIAYDMTIYAKWVNRKPTSWRIRYIDDQGRVLAQEDKGNDNLFTVLFRYGKLIPDYAVDYESKNLTLSSDQMNLLDFIYTYRVKTNWVTEDGTPIKETVYGTFGPEVFDGYVYVSTNTAINGDTTHVYRWVGISTPKTADHNQMAWYMAILCLSSLAVVSIAYMKKSYR